MRYHSFVLLICLPLIVSTSRLCFEKSAKRSLFARSLLSIRGLTEEKCFSACLEMPRDSCKSITYTPTTKVCQLNGKSKNDVKIVKNPMSDFYHRLCYEGQNIPIRRDAPTTDENCFATTPGKVLIGIVDQLVRDVTSVSDCQSHCASAQTKYDITCKSAMYYEKEKECILASQAKSDIPDLFIDDDKSVYFENKCLDQKTVDVLKGSSKFEKKPETLGEIDVLQRPAKTLETKTTTLATILNSSDKNVQLEVSGYDGPSDSVSSMNREDVITTTTKATTTTSTTTPKPVNPKIIDSYNVINIPKSDYGRRLRDTRIKSCFSEVRPAGKMEALRVVKAYNLEQCTDMCRICAKCLPQLKKCQSVAFDVSRELCALSAKQLTDGGAFNDDIVYHNRAEC